VAGFSRADGKEPIPTSRARNDHRVEWRHRRAIVGAATAACAVFAAGLAVSPEARGAPSLEKPAGADVIEGQYIVVFDQSAERVGAETAQLEDRLGFDSELRFNSALEGFSAELSDSQVRSLSADPEVDFVSEDHRVSASASVPLEPGEEVPPTGVRRVLAATSSQVRQASGVNVAVIDTGIQLDHPDLNAAQGTDCVDPGTPASDGNGHGTHVAGTIPSTAPTRRTFRSSACPAHGR
jgi:hypothetical protein